MVDSVINNLSRTDTNDAATSHIAVFLLLHDDCKDKAILISGRVGRTPFKSYKQASAQACSQDCRQRRLSYYVCCRVWLSYIEDESHAVDRVVTHELDRHDLTSELMNLQIATDASSRSSIVTCCWSWCYAYVDSHDLTSALMNLQIDTDASSRTCTVTCCWSSCYA